MKIINLTQLGPLRDCNGDMDCSNVLLQAMEQAFQLAEYQKSLYTVLVSKVCYQARDIYRERR